MNMFNFNTIPSSSIQGPFKENLLPNNNNLFSSNTFQSDTTKKYIFLDKKEDKPILPTFTEHPRIFSNINNPLNDLRNVKSNPDNDLLNIAKKCVEDNNKCPSVSLDQISKYINEIKMKEIKIKEERKNLEWKINNQKGTLFEIYKSFSNYFENVIQLEDNCKDYKFNNEIISYINIDSVSSELQTLTNRINQIKKELIEISVLKKEIKSWVDEEMKDENNYN